MRSSSNNAVDYAELFNEKFGFNSHTELKSYRVKLKWPYMVNFYHQKTFIIVKLNEQISRLRENKLQRPTAPQSSV